MSEEIAVGDYVWAKFANTSVKWPGKLEVIEEKKCFIWVESEQNVQGAVMMLTCSFS